MTDHPSFPASWYPLCRSSELKRRQVLGLEAFGFDLAVFRTASGKVVALQAQCVHMGADLSRGRVVGEAGESTNAGVVEPRLPEAHVGNDFGD